MQQVEAEKLAERLRGLVQCRSDDKSPLLIDDCACVALGLLAESVEYFGSPVFVRNAWLEQWLRRVAAATEGGEGHEVP